MRALARVCIARAYWRTRPGRTLRRTISIRTDPPGEYLDRFETARQAASGRPIWITECGIRLQTDSEEPWGDLVPADERRQAEFVARSYASSLYAGTTRHFYFILGNYIERGVQFGLLRHDLTPRPGYVALAAVGRFLAGAECLGRLSPTVYAFRAQPDGKPRDVLVAWGDGAVPGDLQVEAVYDHLGRPTGNARWGQAVGRGRVRDFARRECTRPCVGIAPHRVTVARRNGESGRAAGFTSFSHHTFEQPGTRSRARTQSGTARVRLQLQRPAGQRHGRRG